MTILSLHSESVQESWLDAYGHLNEAYYLVPFTNTTWILQDYFDIGVPYFKDTGCAIYTVETHLRYLNDVRASANMEIQSMILGSNPKKIWFAHQMTVDGVVCATAEFMTLHYNTRESKVDLMPEAVQQKLKETEIEERPDWIGRQISLVKK